MIQHESTLQSLVDSIRGRGPALGSLADQLRSPAILEAFEKWNYDSWCIAVAGDSLVRLRLLTEQNFKVVETIGLVAVARYIFELALWLRLFAHDRRYGLVYFDQLLVTQERFLRATLAQLEREIAWLKLLGESETKSHGEVLKDIDRASVRNDQADDLVSALRSVSGRIDAEAARRFSIFAEGAQINGYAFQAYLVETRALPPVRQALQEILVERNEFESRVPEDIRGLRPKRWQWRAMAERVGRLDEYEYVYSFASKLLHATPASITTDQKNLEIAEMQVFLKYIDIAISDVLALAADYLPRDVAG